MFDLAASWDFTRSTDGQPSADDILRLACSLKASDAVFKPYFMIAPETYKAIQRTNSQRPHVRKLRKCHTRRRRK